MPFLFRRLRALSKSGHSYYPALKAGLDKLTNGSTPAKQWLLLKAVLALPLPRRTGRDVVIRDAIVEAVFSRLMSLYDLKHPEPK